MFNCDIQTDMTQIDALLHQLEDENRINKIMMMGLEAGANVLRNATMQNMKSWPGASHYSKFVGGPIYEGVRIKKDKAYNEVKVDILSNNSSGDWRIRFYEHPIKQRITKKGQNRGTLKSYYFFRDARNNSQHEIDEAIVNRIHNEMP